MPKTALQHFITKIYKQMNKFGGFWLILVLSDPILVCACTFWHVLVHSGMFWVIQGFMTTHIIMRSLDPETDFEMLKLISEYIKTVKTRLKMTV